jgi:ABC-2 type transport system ATP-binding protein
VSGLQGEPHFGDRVAFDDVSFEVGYGEVFGFLGPNGAGKTTTVRALATLIAPSAGAAVVAGIPLSAKNGPAIRSRISMMPESPGLYLRLTVTENLQCFAGLYELDDVPGRIGRALQAVNLEDRARDLCGSLSKGLRQRVALARALLNDPAVLFLDEPTSGLDPVATREVHELIASLREQGVTIFLTTHRLEEAERLCDRVAILNTTLRLIGRPDELRQQLFRRSLDVGLRAPLDDPKAVFGALPGVEGWEQTSRGYTAGAARSGSETVSVARALVRAGADMAGAVGPGDREATINGTPQRRRNDASPLTAIPPMSINGTPPEGRRGPQPGGGGCLFRVQPGPGAVVQALRDNGGRRP